MTSTKPKLHTNVQPTDIDSPASGDVLIYDGSNWINGSAVEQRAVMFYLAGDLEAKEYSVNIRFPFTSGSLKATRIQAEVETAPTGASLIAQVRRYDSSGSEAVGSVTVAAGDKIASQGSISNDYISPGYKWKVAVIQVGSTVAGSDLVIQVVCDPYGLTKAV
jgi:hypothetical protein